MPSLSLSTPLSQVRGVGPQLSMRLKRLGLETIRDLLWHFPNRYEDFSKLGTVSDLAPGEQATIIARVTAIKTRTAWRRQRLTITEATLEDATGTVHAIWFNKPYIEEQLAVGTEGAFAGKVQERDDVLTLQNPSFERQAALAADRNRNTARLVPIYPETKGLTSRGLRFLTMPILEHLDELADLTEILPQPILEEHGFPGVREALWSMHFPATLDEPVAARRRFAFQELFLLQLEMAVRKQSLATSSAPVLDMPVAQMQQILSALPFALTTTQKQSLWDVMQDFGKPHPMNRLLQGDVGSGKTIVAVLASLVAHHAGYQTAIMAPTDILARQHFAGYEKLFKVIDGILPLPTVVLLTGKRARILYPEGLVADADQVKVRGMLQKGSATIAIGTHALITAGTHFAKLGFVAIDEQHRFGVTQRKSLISQRELLPHFLSMSATPIPRTIMMTVFGDLSTSLITELPKNRKPIRTTVAAPHDRHAIYEQVRSEIQAGRQGYVICPLIEAPDTEDTSLTSKQLAARIKLLELKTVTEEYERLRREIFPELRVGLLHGGLKPKEKEDIMERFTANDIQLLVSTSVVEVGVDVPNATVMLIEDADRFGLAQLYQFRGRVGRGEHQSYCYLVSGVETQSSLKRLRAVATAKSGFELAEHDLKLRGPGQFLGEAQAGLPDLAMQYLADVQLVTDTKKAVQELLASTKAIPPHLVRELNALRRHAHQE